MSKQRISNCTKENIKLIQELRKRVEVQKLNPVKTQKQKIVKVQPLNDKVQHSSRNKVVQFRTPKNLVCFHIESNYADIPKRPESKLVQFAIKKGAQELRNLPKTSGKKKRRITYQCQSSKNGSS